MILSITSWSRVSIILQLLLVSNFNTINNVSSFSFSSPSSLLRQQQQQQYQTSHPTNTLSKNPFTHQSKNHNFKSDSKLNSNTNNNEKNDDTNKASVSLSSTITSPTDQNLNTPTAIIDYILSILTSDIGSIIIGSIGLLIALFNRLATIDIDTTNSLVSTTYAESINIQSRNDLLAVFASGAVLLNGISKLDVTSVLAESVLLDGIYVDEPLFLSSSLSEDEKRKKDLNWAIESMLSSTPAKTAILLTATSTTSQSQSQWQPVLMAGVIPDTNDEYDIPKDQSTPILDRFLKQENAKESYLPTLQALPGKVEFTYLPSNTQEALLLPISVTGAGGSNGETNSSKKMYALVLGSNTAKSFTPRDIAWSQVLARRIGDQMV